MLCRHSKKSVQMNRCVAFALGQTSPVNNSQTWKRCAWGLSPREEFRSPSTAATFSLSLCCSLVLNSPTTNLRSVAYLSDLHTVCVLKFNSPRLYWKLSALSCKVIVSAEVNKLGWGSPLSNLVVHYFSDTSMMPVSKLDLECQVESTLFWHSWCTFNAVKSLYTHWRGLWRKIYVTVSCKFLLPGFMRHSM